MLVIDAAIAVEMVAAGSVLVVLSGLSGEWQALSWTAVSLPALAAATAPAQPATVLDTRNAA